MNHNYLWRAREDSWRDVVYLSGFLGISRRDVLALAVRVLRIACEQERFPLRDFEKLMTVDVD